ALLPSPTRRSSDLPPSRSPLTQRRLPAELLAEELTIVRPPALLLSRRRSKFARRSQRTLRGRGQLGLHVHLLLLPPREDEFVASAIKGDAQLQTISGTFCSARCGACLHPY